MSSFEAARLEKEWIATLAQTEFRLPIYIAAPTQRLFAAPKPGEAAGNGHHHLSRVGAWQFDCVAQRRLTCLTRSAGTVRDLRAWLWIVATRAHHDFLIVPHCTPFGR
jgi:hypothetical protein